MVQIHVDYSKTFVNIDFHAYFCLKVTRFEGNFDKNRTNFYQITKSANYLYQGLMCDFLNFDSKCKIVLQETEKIYKKLG